MDGTTAPQRQTNVSTYFVLSGKNEKKHSIISINDNECLKQKSVGLIRFGLNIIIILSSKLKSRSIEM